MFQVALELCSSIQSFSINLEMGKTDHQASIQWLPWTYAGTVNIGTSLHIPVSKRFSLTLGADLKYLLNTDYLDAFKDTWGSDMLVLLKWVCPLNWDEV